MSGLPGENHLGQVLDTLCPMHAVLDATGQVIHLGPTLKKLVADRNLNGARFTDLFEIRRPRVGPTMHDLRRIAHGKLHLRLRDAPCTELKGVLVPLPEAGDFGVFGGAIVNLSFGISVTDAVRDFSLTSADFAPTDLTVEMLYLIEAKSAVVAASRKLNLQLQGAKIAAEEQAFTDTLTGLKNRRAMDLVLRRLIQSGQNFALMNLDLDYFKAVNDNFGHAAGDHVLQHVARVMVEEIRREDTIIRTGGDEFVLVLTQKVDRHAVAEIARRLIERLEQPISFGGHECRISASVGATLSCRYSDPDLSMLHEDADCALYAAKGRGRGCFVLYHAALRSGSGQAGELPERRVDD